MLILQLTDAQIAAIMPAHDRIQAMSDEGKPGMLLAQVYRDHMRVGVMSHEDAIKIQTVLGRSVGVTHRTAYDLPKAGSGPVANLNRPWEEPA